MPLSNRSNKGLKNDLKNITPTEINKTPEPNKSLKK